MKLLRRKILRDILHQKWQFLAVVILVFLGVVFYVATFDSYQNLKLSYEETHRRFRFGDFWLKGAHFSALSLEKVQQVAGVKWAERRLVVDSIVKINDEAKIMARLIGIPANHQPLVNQLHLVAGQYPTLSDGGVLVEKHLADFYQLSAGDAVFLWSGGEWVTQQVSGVVISPEYIWPAKSRQEIVSTPDVFGVIYLMESDLEVRLNLSGVRNEMVVVTEHSDRQGKVEEIYQEAKKILGEESLITGYLRQDQPAHTVLKMDLDGFAELAFFFPFLFLTVAALSISIMMSRLVVQQKQQIGILRADGHPKGVIVRHYLSFGFMIAVTGYLPGALIGLVASRVITFYYTSALSIPLVITSIYPLTLVIGLVMSLAGCLLSSWAPARLSVKLAPAEAMRGEIILGEGKISWGERIWPGLRRISLDYKIPLRGIERNWKRSLSTMAGIIFACLLCLVSVGLLDSVDYLLDRMFTVIFKEDLVVYFQDPVSEIELEQIQKMPGVSEVEAVEVIPVVIHFNRQTYSSLLFAMSSDTKMHGFLDEHDQEITLPEEGVLLGIGSKKELGLKSGDWLELGLDSTMMLSLIPKPEEADVSQNSLLPELEEKWKQNLSDYRYRVRVQGFVNEPVGSLVYLNLNTLQKEAGLIARSGQVRAAYLKTEKEQRPAVRQQLNQLAAVAQVQDSKRLLETIQEMMKFFYVFVGVMLGFGLLMAFGLIFNTMMVNIMERSREIATLRILGYSQRRITWLITVENMLLVLPAIGPGLILGYLLSKYALEHYNNDLFQLRMVIYFRSYLLVSVFVILTALFSQWPALRKVHSLDLTRIIKERVN